MNYKIVVTAYEKYEVMKDVIGLRKRSVEKVYDCGTMVDALEISDIIKNNEFKGERFIDIQSSVYRI